MKSVTISVTDMGTTRLPALCPRHGRVAVAVRSRTFHRRGPLWLIPLLIVVFFLALLVASIVDDRSKVTCRVYECQRCQRNRRYALVGVALAWCLFLVAMLFSMGILLITLVAAPVVSILLPRAATTQGWLTKDRQAIVLKPVADAYLRALSSNALPPRVTA